MITHRVLLSAALVLGLAFALAADAQAGPVTNLVRGPDVYAGGVSVGFGVGVRVPIGPAPRHYAGHRYRVRPAGRWVIQEREIYHPGEFIGYDSHGNPVHTQGHWDVVRERVWVPAPRRRVIRHGHVRPHAYVRVGGRIR